MSDDPKLYGLDKSNMGTPLVIRLAEKPQDVTKVVQICSKSRFTKLYSYSLLVLQTFSSNL